MAQNISINDQAELAKLLKPRLTKYVIHKPHPKQAAFLLLNQQEVMFGGAGSSGKSDSLLMAALQYVDVPGYSALILRRTFADLSLPGAIMDRAREWMSRFPEVHWSEKQHRFTFPSGATLQFGYLETANDKHRYQGAEFQYVGFDELTQFPKADYEYLFTRLRRTKNLSVPLRMRSATNPGGPHGIWVREHFVDKPDPSKRIFLPATVHDNPTVSYEEYAATLERVNEVDRARMLYGDWDIQPEGLVYPEMDKTIFDSSEKFKNGMPPGEHYGGIDWGFTSPAVFLIGVLDENKHFWIYYERYVRGKTVAEHAAALPRENEVLYFADSADPQSIAQLKKEDFIVRKANKDIKFGINIVHEWIRSGRLHISSDCKALFQEAKLYRRKSTQVKEEHEVGDHDGGDPDIPIKKNDHALDSLRYTLVGVHKLIGGLPKHENDVEEVSLPENQVEIKKQWKSSESPYRNFDLGVPDKEEVKRHHDWNNPRWWNK
jgi:PBSX family phage terminase large subunit